jgi:hypothetical protein
MWQLACPVDLRRFHSSLDTARSPVALAQLFHLPKIYRPVAIAPFFIRWGPDVFERRIVVVGPLHTVWSQGAILTHPSWVSEKVAFAPFRVEPSCARCAANIRCARSGLASAIG